jgi:hypothetical protein
VGGDGDVLALREAALLLGGEQKLAKFLEIEEWLVSRWLEGLGHPPDFIFSRCRDRIESGKQAAAVTDGRDEGLRCRH